MTNKILVVSLERRFEKFEKDIKKTSLKALKLLKKKNISVEIYLVGSQKMRFLNKKFRSKNKAADVLSFEEPKEFISPKSKFKKIGEIYLSHKSLVVSRRLLIHGLLHLFGYHHYRKSDRIKMEHKERKLFEFLIINF